MRLSEKRAARTSSSPPGRQEIPGERSGEICSFAYWG
jgi:hypothetical protein